MKYHLPVVSGAEVSSTEQAGAAVGALPGTSPVFYWWSEYFTQSFYHATVLPLLATTVIMAYLARPSINDACPKGFGRFKWGFLAVWALCVAADWLQGPYVYALYAAYGYTGPQIAELFVAGFGASLVFGCVVGPFADTFGRKNCCLMYCVLYIVSCMTKHFNRYSILMVGRLTGGVATSMLFSCFECWLVSEHLQRNNYSGGLLGYMFGMMYTVMYCVAIASGLAGQVVADSVSFQPISPGSTFYVGGYLNPFDLAIVCLIVGMALIWLLWEENYGHAESAGSMRTLLDSVRSAGNLLVTDRKVLLLCVVVSTFEGSMFAFVFNWTPALESDAVPPPHGVIFALFMMACMCGASASTMLGPMAKPALRLIVVFAAGVLAFAAAAVAASRGPSGHLRTSLAAFMIFEFCVGVYYPSIGVLKSEIVPEQVRGTMYNLYRVPLNAIVVVLLLGHISMATCFQLCACLLTASLLSMSAIAIDTQRTAAKLGDEESAKSV